MEQHQQTYEYLKTIRNSGELLLAIISDLLDISKIEAGQLYLDDQPFSLRETLKAVYDSAQTIHARVDFNQHITMSLTLLDDENANDIDVYDPNNKNMSNAIVDCLMGDPTRIQQVLHNLLHNSIKFTLAGGGGNVQCKVRLVNKIKEDNKDDDKTPRTDTPKTQFLEFQVSDTGVGIPQEKQQEIFRAFRQAHPRRDQRELGGTGLGLTISKKLVEMMGGEISLTSSTEGPNRGTVIAFTLPYRPVNEASTEIRQDTTSSSKKMMEETGERLCSPQTPPPPPSKVKNHLLSSTSTTSSSIPVLSSSSVLPVSPTIRPIVRSSLSKPSAAPLPPPPQLKQQDKQISSSISSSSSPCASIAKSQGKVLIVDDNMINLKLAVRLVNKLGYETITAMNGKEAVTIYQSDRLSIHAILMDKEMPIMNGKSQKQFIMMFVGFLCISRVSAVKLSRPAGLD